MEQLTQLELKWSQLYFAVGVEEKIYIGTTVSGYLNEDSLR